MAEEVQKPVESGTGSEGVIHVPAECPMCKHKFLHNTGIAFIKAIHAVKTEAGKAADGLGNAVGEAKFGG